MAPNRRARIPGRTVTITATGAMKFTSMTERREAAVVGSVRMIPPTPAMLARMSIRPPLVLDLVQQGDERAGVGQIAGPVARLRTRRPHLLDQVPQPVLASGHGDHHGPGHGQVPGEAATETGRRSRHHAHHPPVVPHHRTALQPHVVTVARAARQSRAGPPPLRPGPSTLRSR